MSRFGTTGFFYWNSGDTFTAANTITLSEEDMPQYPMETNIEADTVEYTTLSGSTYVYENYSKRTYLFNWSDLREITRGSIYTMVNSYPICSFKSGASTLGTFRVRKDTWKDMETSHELYDVSFAVREV